MRCRKPCLRARFRVLGWNVRFISDLLAHSGCHEEEGAPGVQSIWLATTAVPSRSGDDRRPGSRETSPRGYGRAPPRANRRVRMPTIDLIGAGGRRRSFPQLSTGSVDERCTVDAARCPSPPTLPPLTPWRETRHEQVVPRAISALARTVPPGATLPGPHEGRRGPPSGFDPMGAPFPQLIPHLWTTRNGVGR